MTYYSIAAIPYTFDGRSLIKAIAPTEGATRTNGAGHTIRLVRGRWHRTDQGNAAKPQPRRIDSQKVKHAIIHEGDLLGENIASWKVGRTVGGAVANFALAHGASTDPEATRILSETIVQATTATLINAVKQYRKTGTIDGRNVAAYFVKQTAAAFLGKYAHAGTEWAVQQFGMQDMAEQVLPLLAGKVTGISTVIGMGRYHLDSRIVDLAIDRGKHDLGVLQNLVAKLAKQPDGHLNKSANSDALDRLLWDLAQLGILIALSEGNLRTR